MSSAEIILRRFHSIVSAVVIKLWWWIVTPLMVSGERCRPAHTSLFIPTELSTRHKNEA
jgi:hypothetical protein